MAEVTRPRRIGKLIAKGFLAIVLVILALLVAGAVAIAVIFIRLDKTNGEIVSSGEKRTYLLFVPTTYDSTKPSPLVISMHGLVEWPAHQMQISHWNDLAQEYGFLVVYPEGTGFPRRWRASGSGDATADVRFISDLIDKLGQEYNVDRRRVYTNGLSNGGGMSFLLGCVLADRIAAVGSVSGAYLYPLQDCHPSRPVPMIAFHGTADPIVPYFGGRAMDRGFRMPVIPDWMAARAALNGCGAAPANLPVSGQASGIRYSGCSQGADVVFYTIDGGGHSWPGGDPLPEWIVGTTTQDVDATRVMWEFFRRYSITD
jgi:polyhydroxybutyrate depolymerase